MLFVIELFLVVASYQFFKTIFTKNFIFKVGNSRVVENIFREKK